MNRFLFSLALGAVLTAASYGAGYALGLIDSVSWLEAFAVWTSYSCTYLCVKQTRWNYPVGVVTTAAWSAVFWQTGAPALAAFNLYLVFSLAYGWFRWRPDSETRPVTDTPLKSWPLYALLGVGVTALFLGANWAFNHTLSFYDATSLLSPIDVGLAAFSGVAQFLLDNKKSSNWLVWIGVDVVSIPYMFSLGLPVTAFQYVLFTANAVWGYYEWRKSMRVDEPVQDLRGDTWPYGGAWGGLGKDDANHPKWSPLTECNYRRKDGLDWEDSY